MTRSESSDGLGAGTDRRLRRAVRARAFLDGPADRLAFLLGRGAAALARADAGRLLLRASGEERPAVIEALHAARLSGGVAGLNASGEVAARRFCCRLRYRKHEQRHERERSPTNGIPGGQVHGCSVRGQGGAMTNISERSSQSMWKPNAGRSDGPYPAFDVSVLWDDGMVPARVREMDPRCTKSGRLPSQA